MKLQLLLIFNIICISAENLNYIKVLDHGGYYGYVCTPEAYESKHFGNRLTECVHIRSCMTRGRDSAHFHKSFEEYPLRDNVENGMYLRCKIMCGTKDPDFTFEQPLEDGPNITRRLAYEYVNLSPMVVTMAGTDGSYVAFRVSNTHLIWEKRIIVKFDNHDVYYDNLTSGSRSFQFKMHTKKNSTSSRYELSNVYLKYGIDDVCANQFEIGRIVVMKKENTVNAQLRTELSTARSQLIECPNKLNLTIEKNREFEKKLNESIEVSKSLVKLSQKKMIKIKLLSKSLVGILCIVFTFSVLLNIFLGYRLKSKSTPIKESSTKNPKKRQIFGVNQ